jgi:hypothetical protein
LWFIDRQGGPQQWLWRCTTYPVVQLAAAVRGESHDAKLNHHMHASTQRSSKAAPPRHATAAHHQEQVQRPSARADDVARQCAMDAERGAWFALDGN